VAAGSPEVPAALVDQLRDPGRLVIPVGNRLDQELYFVQRKNGQILTRTLTGCRFVPLVGQDGWNY
jgi:protein-L-isoaspartate(D-aspartate) O-methyltransferase